jgi:hypothetical protein
MSVLSKAMDAFAAGSPLHEGRPVVVEVQQDIRFVGKQ